jgi:hypothetical protein
MAIYVIEYEYTDDDERRTELRPLHQQLMRELTEAGVNLGSGTFGEEPGAMFLFRAETKDDALAISEKDPFRIHGIVASVRIRQFVPFFGTLANL